MRRILPPANMSSAEIYIKTVPDFGCSFGKFAAWKEEPVARAQLVPDCRREQTYIRGGILCYMKCEICYLVHLELKIGLVNDIVCELIYVNVMPVMDMIICEP